MVSGQGTAGTRFTAVAICLESYHRGRYLSDDCTVAKSGSSSARRAVAWSGDNRLAGGISLGRDLVDWIRSLGKLVEAI
jgi:hypothetical protein